MKTVLFHHIPKTAGSTIYDILERQYAPGERFRINGIGPEDSINAFHKMSNQERQRYRLIYGHLADHFLPMLNEKPVCLLFLRNPIEHFISTFYYIKRAKLNRYHKQVSQFSDIENFIELRKNENLDNLQTRHVAGETDFILDTEKAPSVWQTYGDQLLKQAMQRLQDMDYVLLTEYFDESICILYQQLGWQARPFYKRVNETKGRPGVASLNQDIIKKIEILCAADLTLYEAAKKKFELLLQQQSSNFVDIVRRFKKKNRFLNKTGLINFVVK